ncbi:EamA family transporter [Ancylobacter sonchi]|uniref:DMT family transporter n=1 Tax=Ancylobacter sonchi TaxID=1937790 RepID=UPI001BD326E1|nr:EamA family transporter [Ancylobacter sonchi]MBS7535319.1 EamA family transporter [Ancylobacter sonchi]
MSLTDKLLAAAVVACWSANLVLVKLGVAEIPPLLMSLLRFMLVAALLVPLKRVSRRQLPWILLVSVTFGAMHFGFLFIALGVTEAGTSAVLVQLGAPIASLLACLVFREPLGVVRAAGLVMTVVGVVVLALGPTFPGPLVLGLLVASATGWAITNLVVKLMPPIDAMALTGWSALFAIPQMALATALFEDHAWASLAGAGWHGWAAVVYSALVSSVLAYGIWYRLLARNAVNAVVPYSMLNPVFAIGLGALVFGETVPALKLVGTALILAGVVLVLLPRRTPAVG